MSGMIEDQTKEKIKLKRLPRNLISRNGKRHLTPSDDFKEGKAMSYQIAVSLAAAAIGISCIATDASARGGPVGFGGGGFHGVGPVGFGGGARTAGGLPVARIKPYAVGFGAGAGTGGVGGAVAAPSYAVPLYDAAPSNGRPACGYYPYPRCRRH